MEMRCENDTCIFSSFPQKININVKKAYIKKLFIKFYVIIIDMDAKLLYSKCQSITFLNFVQFNIETSGTMGYPNGSGNGACLRNP
ncbi:hypothetical protein PbDSM24746_25020 [Paenibacillus macerans]|nr:hypothetical protein PbDSM24746_25020 [Paenibacillus macerans]GBK68810.1 hypothetical protein PbJCM17693_25180 [Paenibacillus macerans]